MPRLWLFSSLQAAPPLTGSVSTSSCPPKQHREGKRLLLPYFHQQTCQSCSLLFVTSWPCVCKLHNEQNTPRDKWPAGRAKLPIVPHWFCPSRAPFWFTLKPYMCPHPSTPIPTLGAVKELPAHWLMIYFQLQRYKARHSAEFPWALLCSRIAL